MRAGARAPSTSAKRRESVRIRLSSSLSPLSQDANLAFLFVQIDANIGHGWPPSPCARERVISLWGTLCHHVEAEVSRFIPSTLFEARGTRNAAQG